MPTLYPTYVPRSTTVLIVSLLTTRRLRGGLSAGEAVRVRPGHRREQARGCTARRCSVQGCLVALLVALLLRSHHYPGPCDP